MWHISGLGLYLRPDFIAKKLMFYSRKAGEKRYLPKE